MYVTIDTPDPVPYFTVYITNAASDEMRRLGKRRKNSAAGDCKTRLLLYTIFDKLRKTEKILKTESKKA
jgi:hypothetical protein